MTILLNEIYENAIPYSVNLAFNDYMNMDAKQKNTELASLREKQRGSDRALLTEINQARGDVESLNEEEYLKRKFLQKHSFGDPLTFDPNNPSDVVNISEVAKYITRMTDGTSSAWLIDYATIPELASRNRTVITLEKDTEEHPVAAVTIDNIFSIMETTKNFNQKLIEELKYYFAAERINTYCDSISLNSDSSGAFINIEKTPFSSTTTFSAKVFLERSALPFLEITILPNGDIFEYSLAGASENTLEHIDYKEYVTGEQLWGRPPADREHLECFF